MVYTKLRFKHPTSFVGRNGTFTCTGFEITRTMENTVMIEPVTSKDKTGRALLEIPRENLKEFINILKKM